MKKKWLLSLLSVALLAPELFALRAGDRAIEPKCVYVNGKALHLTAYTVNEANRDKLKVLVVFNVWNDANTDSIATLTALAKRYDGKVAFALLSADDRADVNQFVRDNPKLAIPVASDSERGKSVSTYMGGSMLFPKAFVVDYEGNIIWDGEVIDLGEMLERFYAGTFDAPAQKEISRRLDELQVALRSGDDVAGERAAKAVLERDPSNSAALRLRMFMLESTKRQKAAWELLEKQAVKYPKAKKLRFFQLDLALRYAEYADQIIPLLNKLDATDASDGEKMSMYWRLLVERQFDPAVLKSVHARLFSLGAKSAQAKSAFSADELRLYYALAALTAFRTGNPAEAVELQKKAVAVPGAETTPDLTATLNYYETAANLKNVKY